MDLNEEWSKNCPKACTCKDTAFRDLPISKWLSNNVQSKRQPHKYDAQNKVHLYDLMHVLYIIKIMYFTFY